MTSVETGPFVAGGDCIVRFPGEKTMFVRDAIPEERVEVAVTGEDRSLRRARVARILEPSPLREEPPCPMFRAGCGGCQWQHVEATAQLGFKVEVVADAMRRIARVDHLEPRAAGTVSSFGYRTSMRVAVVGGRAALHQRGTSGSMPVSSCRIAHPGLAELIDHGDFGDNNEVLLRMSLTSGERTAVGDLGSAMWLPDDVVTRAGPIEEEVCGEQFRVSTHSFFQSGHEAAVLLATTVDACVDDGATTIVDAYAGVGLLGVVLAGKRAARLIAIESGSSACDDLKHNTRQLDARVVRREVARMGSLEAVPDVVIADPARPGLGPSATRTLAHLGAPQLVLVSCDPASMARDVTLLAAHGYELKTVDVLDLFPQTHHVETVSVFERA